MTELDDAIALRDQLARQIKQLSHERSGATQLLADLTDLLADVITRHDELHDAITQYQNQVKNQP